jgi:hypothetical protein
MTAAPSRRGATPASRRRIPTGCASPLPAETAKAQTVCLATASTHRLVAFLPFLLQLAFCPAGDGVSWRFCAVRSFTPPDRRSALEWPSTASIPPPRRNLMRGQVVAPVLTPGRCHGFPAALKLPPLGLHKLFKRHTGHIKVSADIRNLGGVLFE